MIKSIHVLPFVLLTSTAIALALPGDSCLQMMQATWQGKWIKTYRGDKVTSAISTTTQYLQPHHYSMKLQFSGQAPIEISGTCNENSAIYFENTKGIFPYYLSGTINDAKIHLSGSHGPDGITINMKKVRDS